jgi:hypothetical protein
MSEAVVLVAGRNQDYEPERAGRKILLVPEILVDGEKDL